MLPCGNPVLKFKVLRQIDTKDKHESSYRTSSCLSAPTLQIIHLIGGLVELQIELGLKNTL